MSVSAVWGKSFQSGGKTLGHVIDPRTGKPAFKAMLAAVAVPSATETDALSTALLISGEAGVDQISAIRPNARVLVADRTEQGLGVKSEGNFQCALKVGNYTTSMLVSYAFGA